MKSLLTYIKESLINEGGNAVKSEPIPAVIAPKVYDEIEKNCKGSRETSLVFTKLEEAQFWAIKGITRE